MVAKKGARKGAAKRPGKKAARPRATSPKRAKPSANATPDWRAKTLARIRRLIQAAVPDAVEEAKWKKPTNPDGVPTWSHHGILCTGETYKDRVKLTFPKGAFLDDPARLFNASLDGNLRRAIDLREGDEIDEKAFKALVRAAADLNASSVAKPRASAKKAAKAAKPKPAPAKTRLLSGGNPQIAKGEGDAPVQAYIAAMPGWKRDVGRRLDALIERAVPDVRKAVKWNSPFYGMEGRGWFASFHVFTNYVKVTFFQGTSLKPVPPGGEHAEGRWIDIHADDLDEAQMVAWVKQAAALPGWGKTS